MIKQIALIFPELGIIAFGDPAAHIAMMEDEAGAKRKWMRQRHFLDLVDATNKLVEKVVARRKATEQSF